jgi:hypothetical protein
METTIIVHLVGAVAVIFPESRTPTDAASALIWRISTQSLGRFWPGDVPYGWVMFNMLKMFKYMCAWLFSYLAE